MPREAEYPARWFIIRAPHNSAFCQQVLRLQNLFDHGCMGHRALYAGPVFLFCCIKWAVRRENAGSMEQMEHWDTEH